MLRLVHSTFFAGLYLSLICCSVKKGSVIQPIKDPEKDTSTTIQITNDYKWGNLPIGGGGYVTGMVIHPSVAGIMYTRTDVGGAYKWNATDNKWQQMLSGLNPGVDGIALDPNMASRVYVAIKDGIYRSENKGDSWTKLLSTTFDGNGDLRWTGECIAVDPKNSKIIFVGSRLEGLFKTSDDGVTWNKVLDVPIGTKGIRSLLVDSSKSALNHSSKIYAAVPGTGVFISSDGGNSFQELQGAPLNPNRMILSEGKVFITHGAGVTMYNGTGFKEITPPDAMNKNYCGITIDPKNSKNIVVAQRYSSFYNSMYRSSDAGLSWKEIYSNSIPVNQTREATWWPERWFSSATASITFNPFGAGELFFTDWFGVWNTKNIMDQNPAFTTKLKGLEETVILTLTAPSNGPVVYSGVADIFGFGHDNTLDYPKSRLYEINEGFSISFCEKIPANIAILGSTGNDGTGTMLATSENHGRNWVKRILPADVKLGRIAISATNPDKMVYVAGSATGNVFYTTDRGNTWSIALNAPIGAVPSFDVWSKDFSLAADAVDGDRFYLFKGGYLYTTNDGGKSWIQKNATAIPNRNSYLFVASRPGKAGEIWISLDKNGLYKSENGGETFQKIQAVASSQAFSFGAAPLNSDIPAAYSYGVVNSTTGLFRSLDLGITWHQIDINTKLFSAGVKALAGDRQTFGKIYVGTGGMGVIYGEQQ